MRIIAGKYKGHRIQAVPNKLTRPTTDKVKESLFHMIGPFFDGGVCLDLFAGSGSLAIEALSRGMEKAILVDKQPKAITTIKSNVSLLRLEEQVEVYRNDAVRALKAIKKRELKFDIIFLDPPYYKTSYEKLLETIHEYDLLVKDGLIVCEHDTAYDLDVTLSHYHILKQEKLGNTTGITIFQKG
ncbi:16S rRNA (guanine(966)-N(2))-methyltransferase RsmD [Gracilibacillus oryzae]|uniref:16S rRNA (Guanine(966)-N(2))-methyltransferase RsmD n=1 Tax=Gracilibacillus oryzae TaxID=1672701 RepID=A0A7C8L5G2_9BACI|nr:16S rRNA (guanine(966)-N(2))-methyltransferase RsmD [Gracilibacillus oryzae]